MKENDFSKAERGKFGGRGAALIPPAHLEMGRSRQNAVEIVVRSIKLRLKSSRLIDELRRLERRRWDPIAAKRLILSRFPIGMRRDQFDETLKTEFPPDEPQSSNCLPFKVVDPQPGKVIPKEWLGEEFVDPYGADEGVQVWLHFPKNVKQHVSIVFWFKTSALVSINIRTGANYV